jgi:Surface-adhesin protein E
MIRLAVTLLFVLATTSAVFADWRPYREDSTIIASFDYLSFASFHGQPSVWVRWHYVSPRNGVGGTKIHVTANCAEHRLYEIESNRYDTKGNYLAETKKYNPPKERSLAPGSLDEATFKLLCH